jgi:L-asparaginase
VTSRASPLGEAGPRYRVAVIGTGGTIASVTGKSNDGVKVALPIGELLSELGEAAGVEIASAVDFAQVNGWDVDPHLMWRLASQVNALIAREDVDGVVVTHGTDTIEETAFFLEFTTSTDKPVILTAAMRSADALSADGPANLLSSLRAAASPAMRGLGTVVCMSNELHASRWVRKSHTQQLQAFHSVPGPVATINAVGAVRRTCGSLARWHIPNLKFRNEVNSDEVPVLQAYTGMSGRVIEALAATTGARGMIVEGFGMGNVPTSAATSIRELVMNGVVVVIATRVTAGGVSPVYGGPGGGVELARTGVLLAGDLSAAKARLLLLACLSGRSATAAAGLFQQGVAALGLGSECELV